MNGATSATDLCEVAQNDGWIRLQFEREFDFLNAFQHNVRRFAQKVALSEPLSGRLFSYQELDAEANRLANALSADGFVQGDVLSVALYNCAEFVVAYLAAEKIGVIFTPLNYNWSAEEIAYAFEDSRPKAFIYDAELSALVARAVEVARERNGSLPARLVVVGKTDESKLDAIPFDAYLADRPETAPDVPREGTIFDEAVRLYTSGTTGRAKGVPLTRLNETASAHEVAMRYPLFSGDVTINTTPWFHRGGFHGGLMPTLYVGGEVVALPIFNATTCLKHIVERRATVLLGVPSAAIMVARRCEKSAESVATVRLLVMMGSDLEKGVYEYLKSVFVGVDFINSYGTTESFLNTFLDSKDLPEKAGTIGRASYDDDVALVEPIEDGWGDPKKLTPKDGKTLGEIIVRCSTKTPGRYWNKPKETEQKFHNGFLYTGDLAIWDKNEYITVVGRKDDMMISAGENIYPQPIEEAICQNEKVADCFVVAVSELTRGQALVAYVVPSDSSLTIRELLKFCAESNRLSGFTTPRYFAFVDELPYASTGKKLRRVLRDRVAKDLEEGLLRRN